jgi:hypothetical protein
MSWSTWIRTFGCWRNALMRERGVSKGTVSHLDQAQQGSRRSAAGRQKGDPMTQRRQYCPHGHDTFLVGRDSSYRCLECKRLDSWQARAARVAEAQAIRAAELKRTRAEAERRRKRERDRALAAGGDEAAEVRWQELWSQSLQRGGPGLCQWPLEKRPSRCMYPAGRIGRPGLLP